MSDRSADTLLREGKPHCILCFKPIRYVEVKDSTWTIYGLKTKKKWVPLTCLCR